MEIKKGENPNRKITIPEATYAKGRRAIKRQVELRKVLKPVNEMIKGILEDKD